MTQSTKQEIGAFEPVKPKSEHVPAKMSEWLGVGGRETRFDPAGLGWAQSTWLVTGDALTGQFSEEALNLNLI